MKLTMNDLNSIIKEVLEEITLEEKLNLFLEKNVPTNPSKWAYYKGQAKKKFDVYPSAYASGLQKSIKQQLVAKNWGNKSK